MLGFEKCKWEHSCGFELCMPEFCKEYEAVPMTNADHIRSMSDEELVELIECPYGMQCPIGHGTCGDCILEWLKQPHKENTDE